VKLSENRRIIKGTGVERKTKKTSFEG
jgi:hypothetical protein